MRREGIDVPVDKLSLLEDEPISETDFDGLRLSDWADVVAGAALGTDGPFTIGIFGGWGEGKTSLLKLARRQVDASSAGDGSVTTVWFNAWQYEREEQPIVPMLAAIEQALQRTSDKRGGNDLGLGGLVLALRSTLHGISGGFKAKLPAMGEASIDFTADQAIERYDELKKRWIDRQVEGCYSLSALEALRATQNAAGAASAHRIVVFIDDLDRCFPDRAVGLLENIKLILSERGFIFVLAVDRNVLEAYLDKRYREEFGLQDYGQRQSYLTKFVQLPLWIPSHEPLFDDLIYKVLRRLGDQELREALATSEVTEEIGLACAHNPRQLVRFLNELLIDRRLFGLRNTRDTKFELRLFIVARGLRSQSQRIYRALLSNEELCRRIGDCPNSDVLKELLDDLREHEGEGDEQTKTLSEALARKSLAALLLSTSGKEWLSNQDERKRVEGFLARERPTSAIELEQSFVLENLARAVRQLQSGDEGEVLAACLLIVTYARYPRALDAIPLLEGLLSDKSRSHRVMRYAVNALGALARGRES